MQFDDIKLELRGVRNNTNQNQTGGSFNSFSCTLTQSCTCTTCTQGRCSL